MAELSEDDRRVLDQLRRAAAERDAIPPEERIPMDHPERFAFPIGMDAHGNLFRPRGTESEVDGG
ncbi:hypothetical protein NE236_43095 [Actinoallomurus purpureus]|uniref:hypothetical protein n=1 Tax=Actinoallomurus purpureus TaxID=478114 RepID=UPI002093C9D7|nr:hypothetical protein [Actinoallomurus purpureus]MCO6011755.1 hypothetical protein [Actinoallomurus purpureus]